jgi:hypothetical protein
MLQPVDTTIVRVDFAFQGETLGFEFGIVEGRDS